MSTEKVGNAIRELRRETHTLMLERLKDMETNRDRIGYLIDIARQNTSSWSGGSAGERNIEEMIYRDVALDLLQTYNCPSVDWTA